MRILAAIAIAALLAGCASPPGSGPTSSTGTSTPAGTTPPASMSGTTTAAPAPQGNVAILRELPCDTTGSRDPVTGGHLLTDNATYQREWTKACSSSGALPPQQVPPVDFSTESVVLYAWGEKPSGGHAVEIMDVDVVGTQLEVKVRRSDPGDCPSLAVIMYPAQAVVVEKVPQMQVKWTFEDVSASCP